MHIPNSCYLSFSWINLKKQTPPTIKTVPIKGPSCVDIEVKPLRISKTSAKGEGHQLSINGEVSVGRKPNATIPKGIKLKAALRELRGKSRVISI